MKKIAIDIVLLPPEEVMDKAIAINKELLKVPGENISLDKENCVPHISLFMGVIDEKKLYEIENILRKIVSRYRKFKLRVNELRTRINPTGRTSNSYGLEKNDSLQKMHEEIVNQIRSFLFDDFSEEYCATPPEIKDPTKRWILDYMETSAFDKFHAHISLGWGKFEGEFIPFEFTASNVCVFQLGNYCTCKKKLIEVDLAS